MLFSPVYCLSPFTLFLNCTRNHFFLFVDQICKLLHLLNKVSHEKNGPNSLVWKHLISQTFFFSIRATELIISTVSKYLINFRCGSTFFLLKLCKIINLIIRLFFFFFSICQPDLETQTTKNLRWKSTSWQACLLMQTQIIHNPPEST